MDYNDNIVSVSNNGFVEEWLDTFVSRKSADTNKNNKNNRNNKPNKSDKLDDINKNKKNEKDDDNFDYYKNLIVDKNKLNTNNDATANCINPLCDHDENGDFNILNMTNINCLDDLISLGKSYHCKCNKEYFGVNLKILCDLVVPLTELKNMVGMEKVKTNIINHIIFS